MALRTLVLDLFSKLKPSAVDASQVLFGAMEDLYSINEPVIYKIPNSNYHLVFGDIRKAMSINHMKKWLEEQLKTKKTEKTENVIDGEDIEQNEECDEKCSKQLESSAVEQPELEANEEDVKLIMDQFNIDKEGATKALRDANYDVVNALVELGKNK